MIWERQSLTRARVVHGDPEFALEVMAAVHRAIHGIEWRPGIVDEIRSMRSKLEATSSPRSLKRGPGCMMDVEFLVQMFQIKYGARMPDLLRTNTWQALDALRGASLLDADEHRLLTESYSFLRCAEARLRIVTNRPLNEYPEAPEELEKFARRLRIETETTSAAQCFQAELTRLTVETRRVFERLMDRERKKDRVVT
jgi:[glutamine synthetase] adenylyltransferase / [glutamine synthetase]-adenylyl-L-tyrosine phosphorylase